MKWRVNCREATELFSRTQDERLHLADRVAMRMHLAICRNCTRFARQLQDMRRLLRSGGALEDETAGLSADARQRIETELHQKLKP